MAVARIRTSDPEIVEFLSRHLADSGYELQFVRPGEVVHGDADLEIDATRMDIGAAIAASQHELGLISVLSGVLKAEPQRDLFEEAAQVPQHREYADVSPYAQGAELENQPSALHRAANSLAVALSAGLNSVDKATRSASGRFATWKSQWEAERAERQQRREQEKVAAAERRREEEARRAEEELRRRAEEEQRRAEEERLAAIRREELARARAAEEQRRNEERVRLEALEAQKRAEEESRLRAEAERRREQEALQRAREEERRAEAERLAQIRAEQERIHAEEIAAAAAERERQEQARLAEELVSQQSDQAEPPLSFSEQQAGTTGAQVADLSRNASEPREQLASAPEEALLQPTAETPTEDSVAQREWQPVQAPEPEWVAPAVSTPHPRERRRRVRRGIRERERVFRRAGVAAAIVAASVISIWSLGQFRRPASPLTHEQLMRSASVEQQRPFGPAFTVAPVMRPETLRPTPAKKPVTKKATPRGRTARPRAASTQSAKRKTAGDDGPEVIVHHYTTQKQVQAKAKTKNGVKIISESD